MGFYTALLNKEQLQSHVTQCNLCQEICCLEMQTWTIIATLPV